MVEREMGDVFESSFIVEDLRCRKRLMMFDIPNGEADLYTSQTLPLRSQFLIFASRRRYEKSTYSS